MTHSNWRQIIKPYIQSNYKKAWLQITNTVLPFLVLFTLMGLGLYYRLPYLGMLLMAIPTGAFLVRVFILFHDCTHMSFFKHKTANRFTGHLLSILTFTPYTVWQNEHNKHHGTVGNLDARGVGDVWTMTVEEYLTSSKLKQGFYRLYRNPLFLFVVAPFFLFAVLYRFPSRKQRSYKNYLSFAITNMGILVFALIFSQVFGFQVYLMVQIPVLYVASVMGVWLFFVQHQFEEVYWARKDQWNFFSAALEGSSFYKLPLVLDWLTGHIGYHHIHHLSPRIPNYYLKACHKALAFKAQCHEITLARSFKLSLLNLYDEQKHRLVRIKDVAIRKRLQV